MEWANKPSHATVPLRVRLAKIKLYSALKALLLNILFLQKLQISWKVFKYLGVHVKKTNFLQCLQIFLVCTLQAV